jgi:hypothetical protein
MDFNLKTTVMRIDDVILLCTTGVYRELYMQPIKAPGSTFKIASRNS